MQTIDPTEDLRPCYSFALQVNYMQNGSAMQKNCRNAVRVWNLSTRNDRFLLCCRAQGSERVEFGSWDGKDQSMLIVAFELCRRHDPLRTRVANICPSAA